MYEVERPMLRLHIVSVQKRSLYSSPLLERDGDMDRISPLLSVHTMTLGFRSVGNIFRDEPCYSLPVWVPTLLGLLPRVGIKELIWLLYPPPAGVSKEKNVFKATFSFQ